MYGQGQGFVVLADGEVVEQTEEMRRNTINPWSGSGNA